MTNLIIAKSCYIIWRLSSSPIDSGIGPVRKFALRSLKKHPGHYQAALNYNESKMVHLTQNWNVSQRGRNRTTEWVGREYSEATIRSFHHFHIYSWQRKKTHSLQFSLPFCSYSIKLTFALNKSYFRFHWAVSPPADCQTSPWDICCQRQMTMVENIFKYQTCIFLSFPNVVGIVPLSLLELMSL